VGESEGGEAWERLAGGGAGRRCVRQPQTRREGQLLVPVARYLVPTNKCLSPTPIPENASRRPRGRRGGRRGPCRRTARWMWNGWLRVAQRLSCGVRAFPYPEPGSRQASQCCRLSSSRRCPGAERHSPVGAATGSRLESDACSRVNISEQCRRPTRCLAQQSDWRLAAGGLHSARLQGGRWD
jgi:hypothetical protein